MTDREKELMDERLCTISRQSVELAQEYGRNLSDIKRLMERNYEIASEISRIQTAWSEIREAMQTGISF